MNMKRMPGIFRLAATVTAVGLLATACPTDAGNGADPELRGIVTIDFAAPLGVGTVVTAGVMNLTAGGDIYFQWQRGAAPDFVEHPFGTVKRAMDTGYCLTKGLRNVAGEFSLSFLAYNIKCAVNILGGARLAAACGAK